MKNFRPDVAGLVLAGLVAVCLTVCAVLQVEAPGFLAELGLAALAFGGGAAFPRGAAAIAAPAPIPATPAPRDGTWPLPDPTVVRPARPLADEPETGIFSRVTS